MMSIITSILLVGIVSQLLIMHERERKSWEKERQLLLDRIQSRDLPEFKALVIPPAPRKPAPTADVDDLTPL